MLGNETEIEAVGKNGGQSAFALVHPTGICIHTLLNCDPDGLSPLIPLENPGNAIDNDTFNAVHSMVPGGHVFKSAPAGPWGPVAPAGPDIVLGGHSAGSWLVPFAPFGGVLPESIANNVALANTVEDTGTLAVTANKE